MNVMIDIETMGKGPRSAIAAIGAVEFNPSGGQLGRSFYTLVDLTSSVTAGMVIDADTVLWWLRQAEDARREIATEGGTPLPHALQALSIFLIGEGIAGEIDELIVWANGTSFDFPILAEAYRLCGLPQPWHYFNERDWRTVRKIAQRVEIERSGTHHNALGDARHQARQLQMVFGRVSRGNIDPQEHVDAIYKVATLIRENASNLQECHCRAPGEWGDDNDAELIAATAAEAAADAFIDLQTERDELLAALVGIVEEAQPLGIDRESYQTAIALIVRLEGTA